MAHAMQYRLWRACCQLRFAFRAPAALLPVRKRHPGRDQGRIDIMRVAA
jgi:hypothetical protein